MADFKTALRLMLGNEGGYANVDGDNGGETYAGITRKNFPHWVGWQTVDQHKPLQRGAIINDPHLQFAVDNFYKSNFWDAVNGDKIESQDLANQALDFAVNAGVGAAKKLLNQS